MLGCMNRKGTPHRSAADRSAVAKLVTASVDDDFEGRAAVDDIDDLRRAVGSKQYPRAVHWQGRDSNCTASSSDRGVSRLSCQMEHRRVPPSLAQRHVGEVDTLYRRIGEPAPWSSVEDSAPGAWRADPSGHPPSVELAARMGLTEAEPIGEFA